MQDVLRQLDQLGRGRERVALATVVGVSGATPREPGARLLVTETGRIRGSVSAGCIEGDVCERAATVLAGGAPSMARYSSVEQPEIEIGLGCGGAIEVLVQPLDDVAVWSAVRDARTSGQLSIIAVDLTPGERLGRTLVVTADRIVGSLAQSLDERVVTHGRRLMAEGDGPGTVDYDCDGESARVYFEPMRPPRPLVIVGASDTAIALTRLAKVLGYGVTVVDPRPAFANRDRFPEADVVLTPSHDDLFADVEIAEGTHVVTLAHDPRYDIPAIVAALDAGAAYVGALGSRSTQAKRHERLREMGYGDDAISKIHGPVGLDLGGRAPEEVALTIVAEMQAARHGKTQTSLARTEGRIHD